MEIICDKSQYVESCDTEKSYAIKFNRSSPNMVFLPKSITKLAIKQVIRDGQIWSTNYHFDFPHWLYTKMANDNKSIIDLIISENEDIVCVICKTPMTDEEHDWCDICSDCFEEDDEDD